MSTKTEFPGLERIIETQRQDIKALERIHRDVDNMYDDEIEGDYLYFDETGNQIFQDVEERKRFLLMVRDKKDMLDEIQRQIDEYEEELEGYIAELNNDGRRVE